MVFLSGTIQIVGQPAYVLILGSSDQHLTILENRKNNESRSADCI